MAVLPNTDPDSECDATPGTCSSGVCDGNRACGVLPTGTVCRTAAGACDNAETCNGVVATCPTDTKRPNTFRCRDAADGGCDVAEFCTGTTDACPADQFVGAGSVCRPAAGICDAAETCSGTSAACPSNAVQPATFVCRAAAGGCDSAETCTGSSTTCPTDVLLSPFTVCRSSAGVCDAEERCSGASASCPADAKHPNTVVCRAAAGSCDVAESCSGTSDTCGADFHASSGTVCRASTSSCDPQEVCSGTNPNCPANLSQPPANCAPYACTGAVGCRTTCTTSADCSDSARSVCVLGQCRIGKLVFVSSLLFPTTFGGLAVADTHCQNLAADAGIGGTYKAWISAQGAGNSASERLAHATVPYVLTQGKRVIANDWAGLTDGTLASPINANERGVSVPNSGVLTGTNSSGASTGFNCGNWLGGTYGTAGSCAQADSDWTSVTLQGLCVGIVEGRLYCLEQ